MPVGKYDKERLGRVTDVFVCTAQDAPPAGADKVCPPQAEQAAFPAKKPAKRSATCTDAGREKEANFHAARCGKSRKQIRQNLRNRLFPHTACRRKIRTGSAEPLPRPNRRRKSAAFRGAGWSRLRQ